MPPTAPTAIVPDASFSAPTAPGAVVAAGSGSTPTAPAAVVAGFSASSPTAPAAVAAAGSGSTPTAPSPVKAAYSPAAPAAPAAVPRGTVIGYQQSNDTLQPSGLVSLYELGSANGYPIFRSGTGPFNIGFQVFITPELTGNMINIEWLYQILFNGTLLASWRENTYTSEIDTPNPSLVVTWYDEETGSEVTDGLPVFTPIYRSTGGNQSPTAPAAVVAAASASAPTAPSAIVAAFSPSTPTAPTGLV